MYCTLSSTVYVQTLPTERATSVVTDFFSRGHDPFAHACKARPLTIVGRTSLSVSLSMSFAVMDCLGSILTNKYSEGQPNARYYGGNEVIDKIENLCKDSALQAFELDEKKCGVNVQPYSGSPANFAVHTALLAPHSGVLGLGIPSGGHLTHGYYTAQKKISATSMFFESLPHGVHPETGIIEHEELRKQALIFRPAMILCGASAYTRTDFAKFRSIADEVGAILTEDIAHISGLVATKQHPSPLRIL